MAAARRNVSLPFLALAIVLLALILSGCSSGAGSKDDDRAARSDTQATRRAFSGAAAALLAGDRQAFLARLATDSSPASVAARDELGAVFDSLAPLPWRSFSFAVEQLDAKTGIYGVTGSGRLADAGPPDRVAVVRRLRMRTAGDGVVVLADDTPDDLRSRYLTALRDPLVLRRPGIVVLGDALARDRAELVAVAASRGRERLAALGIDTRATVVVTVYGSPEDARAALGVAAAASRLTFFSHPTARVSEETSPVWDVGVTGPWLRGMAAAEVDNALAHELAHAHTMSWFAEGDKPPALLVEGIAQAAEGSPPVAALRHEVATGGQLWPLPESFAEDDLWASGDPRAVSLGYQVGGALVRYVADRWGPDRVRPFVRAVAAAEPTEAGMDAALGESLGVSWRRFSAGWRSFVLAGG